MPTEISLHVTREPTDAQRAYDMLRVNGMEKFADRLAERFADEIGPQKVYSIILPDSFWRLATSAGVWSYIWQPEKMGVKKASELVRYIGAVVWEINPNRKFEINDNEIVEWHHQLSKADEYMEACRKYPDAAVKTKSY